MRNIAGRLPVLTFSLGVIGMSLMGLPPSAGFVAKWMLLRASLAAGQWWWAVVITLGGLLTAAYVFKILSYTFVSYEQDDAPALRPVPLAMTLSVLGLGILCVLFGFRSEEVTVLLGQGSIPFSSGLSEGAP
jgi:formate hydrogenlyase subunit 3/multisubunit Na+/H+ antiporter MnhD subunit